MSTNMIQSKLLNHLNSIHATKTILLQFMKEKRDNKKKNQSRRNCFRPVENYYNSTYFVKSYVVLYNKTFIA